MIPLYAAILVGGKSRRMGYPKHLLVERPALLTWLERTGSKLQSVAEKTVVVGEGTLPSSCAGMVHIPDISGVQGPLSGLLAAMRYNPDVDWLVVACDMPAITRDALLWLLKHRHESVWGVMPRLKKNGYVEPLFALYGRKALTIFEQQLLSHQFKLSLAANHPKIVTPVVPSRFAAAWQNINTPQQLCNFRQQMP